MIKYLIFIPLSYVIFHLFMKDARIFKYERLREYKEYVLAIPCLLSEVALLTFYTPISEKPNLEIGILTFILGLSVVTSYIDWFYEEIPDYYSYLAVTASCFFLLLVPDAGERALGISICLVVLFLPAVVSNKGMGIGDFKYGMGLFLGISMSQQIILGYALVAACIFTVAIIKIKEKGVKHAGYPLAPALSLAYIIALTVNV